MKLLLAEDNDELRALLTIMFQRHGYDVTAVDNGADAVREVREARLKNEPFGAAIFDCAMPAMGGLAATQAIRDQEYRSGVKVPIRLALLTAHADLLRQDRDLLNRYAIEHCWLKPESFGDLRWLIARWLRSEAPLKAVA